MSIQGKRESPFSLGGSGWRLIRVKFADSIQRLTSLFILFHEVFVVCGDFKQPGELVAYGMTGFDPTYDTFLDRPDIGVAILDEFL